MSNVQQIVHARTIELGQRVAEILSDNCENLDGELVEAYKNFETSILVDCYTLRREKQKDSSTMQFAEIAKAHGVVAIAKMITDDSDAHNITEKEFVTACNKQ
jgi:hypothetical protein